MLVKTESVDMIRAQMGEERRAGAKKREEKFHQKQKYYCHVLNSLELSRETFIQLLKHAHTQTGKHPQTPCQNLSRN